MNPLLAKAKAATDLAQREHWMNLYRRSTLRQSIVDCKACKLRNTCKGPVPFVAPAMGAGKRIPLAIIGEAPGQQEDQQCKPFVGPSGALLDRVLAEYTGIARCQCAVFNMVACRPPGNRTPTPDELSSCRNLMRQQLALSGARVVLLLGNTPLQGFWTRRMQEDGKEGPYPPISMVHGTPFTNYLYQGVKFYPAWHPSFLLRRGEKGDDWASWCLDFQWLGRYVLEQYLGEPFPDYIVEGLSEEQQEATRLRFEALNCSYQERLSSKQTTF